MRRESIVPIAVPVFFLLSACPGPGNIQDDPDAGNDVENCVPLTCQVAGKNCGAMLDGCGGQVECGSCDSGQSCGGGGSANVCGAGSCSPTTCAAEGKDCGLISDGCSAVLPCGQCAAPEFCGGAGVKNVCGQDSLSSLAGCAGVFNPDQVLDLHLAMSPGDWATVQNDLTSSVIVPADFRCGSDPALSFKVGVRHKRSGSAGKPGLKVDFNSFLPGAEWQTLKKLSLENGISEGTGDPSMHALAGEYLGWRLMVRSGAYSSRAAFVRLHVNGQYVGAYVNVEQVDRRFLRSRLGDDTGWLFKLSGSSGDGYKTNSTQDNPYAQSMCFWEKNPRNCTTPSAEELATYLPRHLDVTQMLRFGGVNAMIANADAPLVKENNFYWYDWAGGGRLYIPWDLDTTMKDTPPLFGGPGTTLYTGVLFTHWEDDYDALLTELLAGPLSLANIQAEIDRIRTVAGPALEADPVLQGQSVDGVAAQLRTWWGARHPQLVSELQAHAP